MDLIRVLLILFISLTFSPASVAQNIHSVQAKSPAAGTMFIYPERIPLKAGGLPDGVGYPPLPRMNGFALLRNGELITVKRGSHGAISEAMDANPEFKRAFEQYIANGETKNLPELIELAPIDWTVPKLIKITSKNDE